MSDSRGLSNDDVTQILNEVRADKDAELAEAAKVVRKCHDERDAAVVAERTKDARIAELEAEVKFQSNRAEGAETSWKHDIISWKLDRARAEQAEAQLVEAYAAVEDRCRHVTQLEGQLAEAKSARSAMKTVFELQTSFLKDAYARMAPLEKSITALREALEPCPVWLRYAYNRPKIDAILAQTKKDSEMTNRPTGLYVELQDKIMDLETRLNRRDTEATNLFHDNVKLRMAIREAISWLEGRFTYVNHATECLKKALGKDDTKALKEMLPEWYAYYFAYYLD